MCGQNHVIYNHYNELVWGLQAKSAIDISIFNNDKLNHNSVLIFPILSDVIGSLPIIHLMKIWYVHDFRVFAFHS
jgi:hypothetical protein